MWTTSPASSDDDSISLTSVVHHPPALTAHLGMCSLMASWNSPPRSGDFNRKLTRVIVGLPAASPSPLQHEARIDIRTVDPKELFLRASRVTHQLLIHSPERKPAAPWQWASRQWPCAHPEGSATSSVMSTMFFCCCIDSPLYRLALSSTLHNMENTLLHCLKRHRLFKDAELPCEKPVPPQP